MSKLLVMQPSSSYSTIGAAPKETDPKQNDRKKIRNVRGCVPITEKSEVDRSYVKACKTKLDENDKRKICFIWNMNIKRKSQK